MSSGLDLAQVAAKSSLITNQTLMAVTGNNVARADEENYHRQIAITESNAIVANGNGFFGTGSSVTQITRSYDAALESNYRRANSRNEYEQNYADSLSQIEDLLGPEGENVLSDAVHLFADAVQTVSTTPESTTNRNAMLGEAVNLSEQLNQQYENLRQLRDLGADNVSGQGILATAVNKLNQLAQELGPLNDEIARLESNIFVNQLANDLRDDRNALIIEVQKLVDVDVTELDNGRISLFIGERSLIDGTGYPASGIHNITAALPDPATEDTHQVASITWDDFEDEELIIVDGYGAIPAVIDSRKYITDRMDDLYAYASTINTVVNDILQTGTYPADAASAYDLNGDPGSALFELGTDISGNQPAFGAILTVVMTDPKKIAASNVNGETGNGDNAGSLWEALNDPLTDVNGDGVDDPDSILYKESVLGFANIFLGKIATEVSITFTQANTAESTRDMFQNAVQQLSGVNMDEEMTKMLSIQRSYQASAKLMKTINEMLDVALSLI